jgi:ubiquinone/menaquinone biosynthesis C-methylase UbiE
MPHPRAPGFDETAESYDAWYATPVGHLTDQLEKAAVFALVPGQVGRAADLSCGTGSYALELARRGWRVVGIDRSMPVLRVAVSKVAGRAGAPRFVRADAVALPLRDGSLDLVTIVFGLEFVADPIAVLREGRRALAPQGTLVVAALRAEGLWTRWRRLKRRVVDSIWRSAHFVADGELEAAMRAAGLAPRVTRRVVHYLPWPPVAGLALAWERFARRWLPGFATVVVVQGTRAVGIAVVDPLTEQGCSRKTRSSTPVFQIPWRTPGGMGTTVWGSTRWRTPSSSTMPLPWRM